MPKAKWYFDFISPFSYLQLARFSELPQDLEVELRPVLFAGLLNHWGHMGPAEIPSKRRFVYRFFKWHADRRGLPFTMPPSHPFNPLPALRLALVAGPDLDTVRTIFHHIYGSDRVVVPCQWASNAERGDPPSRRARSSTSAIRSRI